MTFRIIMHSAAAHGALSGLISAALVDFAAFRSWSSFHEATAYNWSTAFWRWGQGAVVGAVTGLGYAAVS